MDNAVIFSFYLKIYHFWTIREEFNLTLNITGLIYLMPEVKLVEIKVSSVFQVMLIINRNLYDCSP